MASIFSKSVINAINKPFSELIRKAALGSPELKREINRTLQQANRRIQNIQKAGLASPAVKAVISEKGKKNFTYFSIANLDLTNYIDWEQAKYEYGRALSFLNNPTSTATGARQYIAYQARELKNIPFMSANKIVDLATDPTIDEYGNVNIFSYGSLLERFKSDVSIVKDSMKVDAEELAQELESKLQAEINRLANSSENFLDRFF